MVFPYSLNQLKGGRGGDARLSACWWCS